MDENVDIKYWGILALLSLVWGSSFILMEFALKSFEPIQLAGMRVAISAFCLSPVLFIHRKNIPWKRWYQFFIAGMIGNGIPAILFFIAQSHITSTLSGLLNCLTPIWTLIVGLLFFGTQSEKSKFLGVILGFIGAAILVIGSKDGSGNNNYLYAGMVVLATLSYGTSANYVKTILHDVKPIIISAMTFFTISIPASIYLLFTDFSSIDLSNKQTIQSIAAICTLAILGTALATILFYYLIQKTSAVFGSTVAYLMPIVALFWGVMNDEPVTMWHLVGMIVILSGVYIIRKKKRVQKTI